MESDLTFIKPSSGSWSILWKQLTAMCRRCKISRHRLGCAFLDLVDVVVVLARELVAGPDLRHQLLLNYGCPETADFFIPN